MPRTSDGFFFLRVKDDICEAVQTFPTLIHFTDSSGKRAGTEFSPGFALFGETIDVLFCVPETFQTESEIPTGDLGLITDSVIRLFTDLVNFVTHLFDVGRKMIEFVLFLDSPQNPKPHAFFWAIVYLSSFSAIERLLCFVYTVQTLKANLHFRNLGTPLTQKAALEDTN